MLQLKSIPPTLVSREKYPKVYAWIGRFEKAIKTAQALAPKPITLKGADAVSHVIQAEFSEPEGEVDGNDPLGHDRGRLVSLTAKEVVLVAQSKSGGKEIRIHHPRWNFRTRAVSGEGAKL